MYEWPPDEKRTPIATSTDSTNSTTDESGGMDISDYYIELKTGSSKIITIDKLSSGYSESDIKWVSSNESVASVNNGTVTAVGSGNCSIKAVTSDGKNSIECTISVTE